MQPFLAVFFRSSLHFHQIVKTCDVLVVVSFSQAKTEAWRQETISGCEALLASARSQAEEARREGRRQEGIVAAKNREISRLIALLSQAEATAGKQTTSVKGKLWRK